MSRDLSSVSTANIDWGDVSALKIAGTTLTVACWVNPTAGPTRARFFGYTAWDTNTGLRGWSFGLNQSAGQLRFIFSKAGVVDITPGSTNVFTNGVWQFAAAAMTGTSNVFYCISPDGTIKTETSNNNQSFSYGASVHHAIAGARSTGSSSGLADLYNGRLAEIAVWDVKLTQDQLLGYMYGGPNRCGIKPVFYAPVWGAVAPEPELSGIGAAGAVSGTAPAADHAPVGCPFPVAA